MKHLSKLQAKIKVNKGCKINEHALTIAILMRNSNNNQNRTQTPLTNKAKEASTAQSGHLLKK